MRKSFTLMAMAAILPLVLLGGAPQASAATVIAGIVTGAGTINPGLTAIPTPQTFTFSGTITVGGAVAANGTDLEGSYLEGAGFVTLTAPFVCPGVFVRIGDGVVAVFGLSLAPIPPPLCGGDGLFAFVADQLPPATVTSYTLIGPGLGFKV